MRREITIDSKGTRQGSFAITFTEEGFEKLINMIDSGAVDCLTESINELNWFMLDMLFTSASNNVDVFENISRSRIAKLHNTMDEFNWLAAAFKNVEVKKLE